MMIRMMILVMIVMIMMIMLIMINMMMTMIMMMNVWSNITLSHCLTGRMTSPKSNRSLGPDGVEEVGGMCKKTC